MYTIDASIYVNSCDQRETGHAESRRLIAELAARSLRVALPTLAPVEIAGAISRTRTDAGFGDRFARAVVAATNVVLLSLDRRLAQRAQALAAQRSLRGADAVYAAVALHTGGTLISRDTEHHSRLVGLVTVLTPEAVLATLPPLAAPAAPEGTPDP
jgi:predicted nucleic acid-binding protein